MRVLAASLSVAVLAGCLERLHANVGYWGVFVFWAVAGIVAVAWPVAFLVAGFGATPRQRRAVFVTAAVLTVSSPGLLLVGWGLVMVLNPEYAIGWYIPARSGGSEIDTAADAAGTGRFMVAAGALLSIGIMVSLGRMASHVGEPEESQPKKSKQKKSKRKKSQPEDEALSLRDQWSTAALALWVCGALFWLVAFGIGLIAMIQYDGVRAELAACAHASASCATDVWVANELPWILAVASGIALLPLIAAIVARRSLSRIVAGWDDLPPALMLATGWLYQAGSVVALASGVLYARWSQATCIGGGSLRRCGVETPWFSFTDEWLHWVIVWALVAYAVLAYLIVFPLLAIAESERSARETGATGAARRHVLIYLVSLAIVIGLAGSAVGWWQRASTPGATSGTWEEYAAENMSPSAHPHLEKAELEVPHGRDRGIPVVANIVLGGDEPEMPSAEVAALVKSACSYRSARWRAGMPQTWVRLAYGTDSDRSRFVQLDCEAGHLQAVTDLLAWMEKNPADGTAVEVVLRSRDDGVLETELYLPDRSATSFRKALTYLCALPATTDVQRSGTISDIAADNSIGDVGCGDPDAEVAAWRDLV